MDTQYRIALAEGHASAALALFQQRIDSERLADWLQKQLP